LRHCPHCALVFEGAFTCPSCQRDIREKAEPSADEEARERRPTSEVPIQRGGRKKR
jgi:uncharacterized Zn finger protein (UPF0148 family)